MLTLVSLVALKPLTGDYGHVHEGQQFTTDSRTAENLQRRGLARRPRHPRVDYKMFGAAPENKSFAPGIRDYADAQPSTLRATGDRVLPKPDVPAKGTRNR